MPYVIGSRTVTLESEPFVHTDKHYVPLRGLVEALGGTITFDNNAKTATVLLNGRNISVPMASDSVFVDGRNVALTAPAFVRDEQMYVPYDFFRDTLGYDTDISDGTMKLSGPGVY